MATSPVSVPQLTTLPSGTPACGWTSPQRRKSSQDPGGRVSKKALWEHKKQATREAILLEHLPLVRYLAHRIHERLPQHVELEDLVGAGVLGLIDAYNKFDPSKDVLFRSYAQLRIRGAILDSLRGMDWGPRELRRKAREMETAKQALTQHLGRRPQENEVAAELALELDAYQALLTAVRGMQIGSLHAVHSEGSLEEELIFLESDPEDDPLRQYLRGEKATYLSAAVAELPEREQRVLQLYYVQEMTLKQIGAVLGVVESRASQIRSGAIQMLRTYLKRAETQGIVEALSA